MVLPALFGEPLERRTCVEAHAEIPPQLVQHVPHAYILGLPEDPVASFGEGDHLRVPTRGVQQGRVIASAEGTADLHVGHAMVHPEYRDAHGAGERPCGGGGDTEAGAQTGTHRERYHVDVPGPEARDVEGLLHHPGDDVHVVIGGLPRMEPPVLRPEHIQLVGQDIMVGIDYPDTQSMGGPLYTQSDHRYPILPHLKKFMYCKSIAQTSDPWSRGYDVALTLRRSPVQIRPGPPYRRGPARIRATGPVILSCSYQ